VLEYVITRGGLNHSQQPFFGPLLMCLDWDWDSGCVQSGNSDCSAVDTITTVRLRSDDLKFKFEFSIYKQLKFEYKI
jgi:hypothetical protein